MLELLLLIPLLMVGLLNMTFQVSVDEITDVKRESVYNLQKYDADRYRSVEDQVFDPATCRCECREKQLSQMCAQKNKVWDPTTCECICSPDQPQICSSGAFFHTGVCRCVPKSETNSQARTRRRPPV